MCPRLLAHALLFVLLGTASGQDAKPKPQMSLDVEADYLHLQVKAKVPAEATQLRYRWAEAGGISEGQPWLPVQLPSPPAAEAQREASWEVALPASRWSELQVQALAGEAVLVKKETRAYVDELKMLTPERISALPAAEAAVWTSYLKRSAELAAAEFDQLAAECRKLGKGQSQPAPGNSKEFELDSDTPAEWFGSTENQALTDVVLSFQTPSGGWSKAVDYNQGKRQPGMHWTSQKGDAWHYCGTLDNRTTTEQIKFLAGVHAATQRPDAKAGALRGIEWLLAAQYPSGGWPQNYPVESGYHEAITLNDNAMLHVLEVLLQVQAGQGAYGFVEEALRQRAGAAFDQALACLAKAQVRVEGKPSVWCAQHDPLDLKPMAARLKEPPALSGSESAEMLKFFMRKAPLLPAITAMVEPGLAWLESHRVTGLRKTKNAAGKTDYMPDAASEEVYWARFYDVSTGKPIFAGAQDGVIYATFTEMAAKNKVGYDYFTTKPGDVVGKEVARWKKRMAKER